MVIVDLGGSVMKPVVVRAIEYKPEATERQRYSHVNPKISIRKNRLDHDDRGARLEQ